jgi:hypothetical protein
MVNHLKILLLASIAALALLGTGTASATKLCTDEACNTVYAAGTVIDSSLSGSAEFIGGGELLSKCTGSTIQGKTVAKEAQAIGVGIESLTWSGCTHTTKTLANGELSVEWINGTKKGFVEGKNSKVTVRAFGFIDCVYGTGSSFMPLGVLTGGSEPILSIDAQISRLEGSGLCPETVTWKATYVVTEPHALFVSGAEPTIKVTPAGENIMKVNESLTVLVENTGQVRINVNFEILNGPFINTSGPCLMELEPEESCGKKIECTKAGVGKVLFGAEGPVVSIIGLKCV